jgi:hypothetical protein
LIIAKVTWEDASHDEDYLNHKRIVEYLEEEFIMVTTGFVIALNDKAIIISPEEATKGSGRFRRAHRIPRGYVKEVSIIDDDGNAETSPPEATLQWVRALQPAPIRRKRVRKNRRDGSKRRTVRSGGARRG